MIRRANIQDVPGIIDMIEGLTASVSGPQRVCRLKTGETLAGLITSRDGAVFVSGGGFIAGQIGRTVISPDPVAWELGWWSEDHSGIRLLRRFEQWATSKGATLIKMTCNGGIAQRILERGGYEVAEIQMCKVVT